jgi:hypothetical protein
MPFDLRRRALVLLLSIPLAACGGETAAPALRVGEVAFAADEVQSLAPAQLAALADLAALAQAVARGEAAALGEPLIERATDRARLEVLPLALGAQAMGLDEAALRAAYAQRPEWELEVRHLVRLVPRWAAPAERAAQRERAEAAWHRAAAGEDFAQLAAEYSEEPGAAEDGGRLQPGREGSWVDPFWNAALALPEGGVSPVVETEYGYHVLRLEARRAVPFEEADRARLLSALVAPQRAQEAQRRWAESRGAAVFVDPPAVAAARELFAAGEASDTLAVAHDPHGAYTAWDLALYRASLPGEQFERAEADDLIGFARRVESDAIEAMWTREAKEMGIEPPAAARAGAAREWERRVAGWAQALGVSEGMRDAELRAAVLRGVAAQGPEQRIARAEIAALRPLLRRRYALSGSALPPSAASSSSETRTSESTR